MTLKPTDMLEIQSAIDEYERKYRGRTAPSAEVALAWRLGKREAAKRFPFIKEEKPISASSALMEDDSEAAEGLLLWVKGLLLVGWWSVVAVVVASIFFFGAFVGGLK